MRPEAATPYLGVSTATTPAKVGPQPGKQAMSSGISGQTAPPPPPVAPASPPKSMSLDQVEAAARRAVSTFIEKKYGPHDSRDLKLIAALQSSAISSAEEYLNQVDLNNVEKLSDAQRLLRQALETKQGLAEISQDILAEKFAKLFVTEQGLKRRLDDPRGEPLTEQEKRNVHKIIWEAERAAKENLGAWIKALDKNLGFLHLERLGDASLCEIGLGSAQDADNRTSTLAKSAEFYVRELDRRAQPATKNR